jgi:hypothetical protein
MYNLFVFVCFVACSSWYVLVMFGVQGGRAELLKPGIALTSMPFTGCEDGFIVALSITTAVDCAVSDRN